jgi:hypothetical protein
MYVHIYKHIVDYLAMPVWAGPERTYVYVYIYLYMYTYIQIHSNACMGGAGTAAQMASRSNLRLLIKSLPQ